MDMISSFLSLIGRYGLTVAMLVFVALAIPLALAIRKRRALLATQTGAVLGIENAVSAVGLSGIAFGVFLMGVLGASSTVMTWACKTSMEYIAVAADHYWADHYAYPQAGTTIAVKPDSFADPLTGEFKYIEGTPHCFTSLATDYLFFASTNAGQRSFLITETGSHDPATLGTVYGFSGTQTKLYYQRASGSNANGFGATT